MILPLVKLPADLLHQSSAIVPDAAVASLDPLIADMIETMHGSEGIGLAAPQIGKNIRLALINAQALSMTSKGEKLPVPKEKDFAIINPKIIYRSRKKTSAEEGCLSVPGKTARVSRPYSIRVEATLADGRRVRFDLDQWLARVFQHEIDHLDGFLIVDRASEVWETEPAPIAAPRGLTQT